MSRAKELLEKAKAKENLIAKLDKKDFLKAREAHQIYRGVVKAGKNNHPNWTGGRQKKALNDFQKMTKELAKKIDADWTHLWGEIDTASYDAGVIIPDDLK